MGGRGIGADEKPCSAVKRAQLFQAKLPREVDDVTRGQRGVMRLFFTVRASGEHHPQAAAAQPGDQALPAFARPLLRSEEHTSELQSQSNLVCRLLLEKKK